MNSVEISLINLCAVYFLCATSGVSEQWLPRMLSASGVKCECVHTNVSRHVIGCQAIRTSYYIYSDKHTSALEEIEISPPNLSEGGSLLSPISP